MPNRLVNETSPYLLQHANNPVEWYPWGKEALQRAAAEDKPIFLSIGYSACHWCHVMAHESFEDEATAALMNEHFVNVKVDREERPDLDQIYMTAVQAMTGSGGWPMSVFVTPEGAPFYGGTYFPPQPRHGLPSFKDLLRAVAEAWQARRDELVRGGDQLAASIADQASVDDELQGQVLSPDTLQVAERRLQQTFDGTYGGWGDAPKFPQPMVLEFLLRRAHGRVADSPLPMVTQTLEAMARGGMYDQLGGGFHRYSVDRRWLVPHFEKMLYDNAQLARVYLHAWQATGNKFFRTVATEILDYVAREMTDSAGGFYSSQDADSEGAEGTFYLWPAGEIRELLGKKAGAFIAAYGASDGGNFEGQNILELVGSLEEREALAEVRRTLFAAREQRVRPGRDEKVLTAWNGLMLAAFAEAGRALNREDYVQVAENNARFLLSAMRRPDGRLLRTWKDGEARLNGYLQDYAFLIEGLLALYQTTFDPTWFTAARELADLMSAHFAGAENFYDTSDDHEKLIARPRNLQDNALPSGNSMAATVLGQLAGLAADEDYAQRGEDAIRPVQGLLARYPAGFAQWLIALDGVFARRQEIAIVGRPDSPDVAAMLQVLHQGFRPNQVVAVGMPESGVPLLAGRPQLDGRATAYVCENRTCQRPVDTAGELAALLNE